MKINKKYLDLIKSDLKGWVFYYPEHVNDKYAYYHGIAQFGRKCIYFIR